MTTYTQRSPWLRSVVLTTSNTIYNILTLVQVITPGFPSFNRYIQIQLDLNAGAANVYIGNPDTLTTSDYGAILVASQAWSVTYTVAAGVELSDISVMSNTNSTQLNLTIIAG